MKQNILIINAGSSSIKWTLFDVELNVIAKGLVERIKERKSFLTISIKEEKHIEQTKLASFDEAVKALIEQWKKYNVIHDYDDITHISFRIVNGGPHLQETCSVTETAINHLKDALDLAPVHNKGAIETIEAIQKVFVKTNKTLHFDTTFHKTLDKVEYAYPIDKELTEKLNIRRYGFHGLNHHYITLKMQSILGKDKVNIVNMHIGNGASLCAIKDSKSFATSMGFTPLAGIMMGTRSGDVDVSIVPYIVKHTHYKLDDVMKMLNEKSGLLGVSGVSQDFRDINKLKAENSDVKFAYDLYVQKIVDYLAMYLNKFETKPDAIVFTAGVAENNASLRFDIINKIHFINLKINEDANNTTTFDDYKLISDSKSEIAVYVVRANEELYLAQEAKEILLEEK
ncbi:acetate/propionate family kinase [Metamycoplasma hyosynoviae]|uniref:Acetate kinase n=2 Tax=Metamycoplasma hyosynoviae TaxID=29559 RepID=A0A4P1QGC8_9BACT|nr:acetate/propionate family kinase [Metamycoplasma hyosynoviae]ASI53880.1 acetate kinase [Metamycoplasma hyosynoviae]MDC8920673.1 acetate/propionate family kinase [Metamycoplasma hyosynoviae]MDD1366512.1 acetate/propionate family kinase [Metamycoplasma hyosynoviae]MDD1372309.1 acetate/propionate family kinase [Metamycoplasma hyosynoviae]MDD7848555.1 acetate/propionate family kinase [Metamycoplasma hyosynoviae]